MALHGWISVGEYGTPMDADIVAKRLAAEAIPHKIVQSPFVRDRSCSIWVPPDVAERAKALLAQDAVPEDKLAELATHYPPPDDA